MKLDPWDEREPFPGQELRTVKPGFNDNPLLYLWYFICLAERFDVINLTWWYERLYACIKRLEWGEPGIYMVQPGRYDNFNSHDNYMAKAAICSKFGFMDILDDMIHVGIKTGWKFKNGKVHILPKDQCFILMCRGYRPTFPQYLHYCADILWNAFFKKRDDKSSVLKWFGRINGMEYARLRHSKKNKWNIYYDLAEYLGRVWHSKRDVVEAVKVFFSAKYVSHPNILMAHLLRDARLL